MGTEETVLVNLVKHPTNIIYIYITKSCDGEVNTDEPIPFATSQGNASNCGDVLEG